MRGAALPQAAEALIGCRAATRTSRRAGSRGELAVAPVPARRRTAGACPKSSGRFPRLRVAAPDRDRVQIRMIVAILSSHAGAVDFRARRGPRTPLPSSGIPARSRQSPTLRSAVKRSTPKRIARFRTRGSADTRSEDADACRISASMPKAFGRLRGARGSPLRPRRFGHLESSFRSHASLLVESSHANLRDGRNRLYRRCTLPKMGG